MPDKSAYEKLSKLIIDLSTTHDTPKFEPHVTLLSGITDSRSLAIQNAEKLANSSSPITATLTRIEFLELYYRCLFFCANKSSELMSVRTQAEDMFWLCFNSILLMSEGLKFRYCQLFCKAICILLHPILLLFFRFGRPLNTRR